MVFHLRPNLRARSFGVALVLLLPVAARAQVVQPQPQEELTPGLTVIAPLAPTYDDNVRRTESNRKGSFALGFSPSLGYRAVLSKHTLDLRYLGDYSWYKDDADANYIDHNFVADLMLDLTTKLTADLAADYKWSHDPLGAPGSRVPPPTEPDTWKEGRAYGELTLGRRTNQAQFSFDAERVNRRYTNNNQGIRNRDNTTYGGTLYYNATPKVSWLVVASHKDIDYLSSANNLDSVEWRFLVGSRWEATAQTAGEIRFGYLKKDMRSSVYSDFSGVSATGSVDWNPRTVDHVTVDLSRETHETTQAGSGFYVGNSIVAAYAHNVTSLLTLDVLAGLQRDSYNDDRLDTIKQVGAGLKYTVKTWLEVGVRYDHSRRDSNEADASYKDNTYMLTLTATREPQ